MTISIINTDILHQTQPTKMPSLTHLPIEILNYVLAYASHDDLKSVRLTCVRLADPVTQILFRSICISKLWTDRHNFLRIAAQPHLASAVRILTWYELAGQAAELLGQGRSDGSRDDVDDLLDRLAEQASAAFWLPDVDFPHCDVVAAGWWLELNEDESENDEDDGDEFSDGEDVDSNGEWIEKEEQRKKQNQGETQSGHREPSIVKIRIQARQAAIKQFLPLFLAAIDAMPELNTIVSQRMHHLRHLPMPEDDNSGPVYPMTAQLFQRRFFTTKQSNEGFFSFLVPAMKQRAAAAAATATSSTHNCPSPITRLHFSDEGASMCMRRLDMSFTQACPSLTHIDLCIGHFQHFLHLRPLMRVIQAAENLESLHICFERGSLPNNYSSDENEQAAISILDYLLAQPYSRWERLRSLHLTSVCFSKRTLFSIVQGLASSLRYLRFDDCDITFETLVPLAFIRGSSLESIVITTADDSNNQGVQIRELFLLDVINSDDPNVPLQFQALGVPPTSLVRTHEVRHDLDGWTTMAISSTRGHLHNYDLNGEYTPVELRRLDDENDDYRNSFWNTFERGLTLPDSIPKSVREDNENGPVNTNDSEYEDDSDSQPHPSSYAPEYASHLRRLHNSPRWNWSANKDRQVFYWALEPHECGGNPTETWRFIHRNGEIATGNEPLDYWSDWEGSEAGDVSEPTPLGVYFHNFVDWHRRPQAVELNTLIEIPYERAIQVP